jgi:hypothetical protein
MRPIDWSPGLREGNLAMASNGDEQIVDIYKRTTDTVVAVGTLMFALSLVVAVYAYLDQERTGRLQRTLSLLSPQDSDAGEAQRLAMLTKFKGRWPKAMVPLAPEKAKAYFDISTEPERDKELYDEWNVARKHLNQLESIAFAYVHDLGDRKTLAAATCLYMARSSRYFKELIDIFGRELPGQSWQVISEAVSRMEKRYGTDCANLKPDERESFGWLPAHIVSVVGLALGMLGVVIVFFSGAPQPNLREYVALGIGDETRMPDGRTAREHGNELQRRRRNHTVISRIGLGCIFIGFALQLWETLLV